MKNNKARWRRSNLNFLLPSELVIVTCRCSFNIFFPTSPHTTPRSLMKNEIFTWHKCVTRSRSEHILIFFPVPCISIITSCTRMPPSTHIQSPSSQRSLTKFGVIDQNVRAFELAVMPQCLPAYMTATSQSSVVSAWRRSRSDTKMCVTIAQCRGRCILFIIRIITSQSWHCSQTIPKAVVLKLLSVSRRSPHFYPYLSAMLARYMWALSESYIMEAEKVWKMLVDCCVYGDGGEQLDNCCDLTKRKNSFSSISNAIVFQQSRIETDRRKVWRECQDRKRN